ncbi:MAG: hypothetical protein ABIN36_15985 [Ferruginibacter sp.]
MIYTYEHALQIHKRYEYLIEKYDETASNITDLCIIPADTKRIADFLDHYKFNSAADSLSLSGFDKMRVRIVIMHEQTLIQPGCMIDLDEYLPVSEKQVEKSEMTQNKWQ